MSSLRIELAFLMAFIYMYIINNSGPNIDPCRTPVVILVKLDLMPLNTTYCLQFDKQPLANLSYQLSSHKLKRHLFDISILCP